MGIRGEHLAVKRGGLAARWGPLGAQKGQLRHGGGAAGNINSRGPNELLVSGARREMNTQENEVQNGPLEIQQTDGPTTGTAARGPDQGGRLLPQC